MIEDPSVLPNCRRLAVSAAVVKEGRQSLRHRWSLQAVLMRALTCFAVRSRIKAVGDVPKHPLRPVSRLIESQDAIATERHLPTATANPILDDESLVPGCGDAQSETGEARIPDDFSAAYRGG